MVSDSWKMAVKGPCKTITKLFFLSTKNMKLFEIVGRFLGLNNLSYHISEDTFDSQFFLSFNFCFDDKTPGGLETWINLA